MYSKKATNRRGRRPRRPVINKRILQQKEKDTASRMNGFERLPFDGSIAQENGIFENSISHLFDICQYIAQEKKFYVFAIAWLDWAMSFAFAQRYEFGKPNVMNLLRKCDDMLALWTQNLPKAIITMRSISSLWANASNITMSEANNITDAKQLMLCVTFSPWAFCLR